MLLRDVMRARVRGDAGDVVTEVVCDILAVTVGRWRTSSYHMKHEELNDVRVWSSFIRLCKIIDVKTV